MSEPAKGAEEQTLPHASSEQPNDVPTQSKEDSKPAEPVDAEAPKKISPAELKKQKQAEKQARRAQQKSSGPPVSTPQKGPPQKDGQKPQANQKQAPKEITSRPLPARRWPSQSNAPIIKEQPKKDLPKKAKQHGLFFGHLYSQPRQQSVVGATKEVHPAILALGLQYSSYTICGSTARMVAMLLAFKAVIGSYQTPHGTSLARHLTAHHLSPQIDFLRSCRPLSISMGNAIRWLKDVIIKIRDRVTAADKLISEHGEKKIEKGDVILTYASSSIVEHTLLRAHKTGIPFTVIVVDSKPLFEGKQLARKLANAGLSVKYFLITGASHAVKQATKVFLGAHAMMSNGRLYSRVGTAIVSMLAHAASLPIIVLCESVKFTERVALDSIVGNEIAPAEELLSESEREALLPLKSHLPQSLLSKLDIKEDDAEKKTDSRDVLKWIDQADNLQFLQILYDVTPAEYINMVITEYGSLPPSSVPVVHRLSTDKR
jgi:translation initiation factor eIF-2B subunit delta